MSNKRIDLKRILADPDLRRKLMVSTIQATQAREGIKTSFAQANRAYYVVTEGEKASFFDLDRFKPGNGHGDLRHEMFVSSLGPARDQLRFDISRRDFSAIEGSPLAYDSVGLVAPLFSFQPEYRARLGNCSARCPYGRGRAFSSIPLGSVNFSKTIRSFLGALFKGRRFLPVLLRCRSEGCVVS